LSLTEGVEEMRRVSDLQLNVAGRIDLVLDRPDASTTFLGSLLGWLDPRDPEVSYEADAVAERLGFTGGISDLTDPAARRELFSGA
jgi:hypothetical protein